MAVIGGAVGGFLAVTILVSLVLLIVFYIRRSYKKKTFDIDNVNSTSTGKYHSVIGCPSWCFCYNAIFNLCSIPIMFNYCLHCHR